MKIRRFSIVNELSSLRSMIGLVSAEISSSFASSRDDGGGDGVHLESEAGKTRTEMSKIGAFKSGLKTKKFLP